jgi:hypothetical protein
MWGSSHVMRNKITSSKEKKPPLMLHGKKAEESAIDRKIPMERGLLGEGRPYWSKTEG